MKAMSLRIRMPTESPCLTPSRSNPSAMRMARSATSAWLRRRSPEMMPRVREVSIIVSDLASGFFGRSFRDGPKDQTRNLEILRCAIAHHSSMLAHRPGMTVHYLPRFRKARRALVDIGAYGLQLVRAADQLLLFDRFGKQRRPRIDRKLAQHAFGGPDRIRALGRDLARDLERGPARIVADPGRKAITQRLLRRKDAARIGQLAQDVVANQRRQDRRTRHIGHQPPFDLHDRHPCVRMKETYVGTERELEAA